MRHLFDAGCRNARDRDPCALCGHVARGSRTDTTAATGDQGNLVLQSHG